LTYDRVPFEGLDPFLKRWYIARVEGGKERVVREELARIEDPFLVFLPLDVPRVEVDPDSKEKRIVNAGALRFPGYAFIAIDVDNDRWERVLASRHVAYLLGHDGDTIRSVEPSVINRIIASTLHYAEVTAENLLIRNRRRRVEARPADGSKFDVHVQPGIVIETEVFTDGSMSNLLTKNGIRIRASADRVRAA
jgi:transcription antitermination factor NusG